MLRILTCANQSQHFPHLQLVVRARNLGHVYELIDRDIYAWERETFESSLRRSTEVLKTLGWESYSAVRASNKLRDHNVQMIYEMHSIRNMFKCEREALKRNRDGWDSQP